MLDLYSFPTANGCKIHLMLVEYGLAVQRVSGR